jgi:hypothetical protein
VIIALKHEVKKSADSTVFLDYLRNISCVLEIVGGQTYFEELPEIGDAIVVITRPGQSSAPPKRILLN